MKCFFKICLLSITTSVMLAILSKAIISAFNSPHIKKLDLDALTKFCYKSTSFGPSALKESNRVNYLFGEDDVYRQQMEGDKEIHPDVWNNLPVKGAFYMLVKNEQLQNVRATMKSIEERLVQHRATTNGTFSYPWILLNHQRFTPDFIKYVRMAVKDPSRVYFGHVDAEVWNYPTWINPERAENAALKLVAAGVPDAFSQYNRKRMRYQTGLFHYHSLFDQVDYVWRMEPGTTFTCNMLPTEDDPLLTMQLEDKKLGFSITKKEDPKAVLSLWPAALQYMQNHFDSIIPFHRSFMPWFINYKHEPTHCFMDADQEWLDLSFLRSDEYKSFFKYMDTIGGFFYERWTDGMVKSVAAAMFLRPRQIKFFNDVGMEHNSISHCPFASDIADQCACDYERNYNFRKDSCTISLLRHIDPKFIEKMIAFAKKKGI